MKRYQVLVVVAMLAMLGALPSWGQFSSEYDDVDAADVNEGEAIPVGPFLFSPAVQLSWQRRDNIRFTPDHPITDDVYLARAKLLFELPVFESYVRFSYSPQYRMYKDYDYDENWSHFFDVGGEFEFSNGFQLGINYRFISTAMETREVDAGGEFMPGEQRHLKHFIEATGRYWLSETDAINVEGSFEDLSWDKANEETFFYPYNRTRFGVAWLHQLNPTLELDLRYRYQIFDALETVDYRDNTSHELTLGLNGQITDVFSSGMSLGWRQTSYDRAPGDPQFDDYSSWLARGYIAWEMAHGSTLRLDLVRSDYPSNYDQNAYYVATGASLIYDLTLENFSAQARIRLQNNDYQVADTWFGETRSDDIITYGIGLGFRFTNYISLRGTWLYEDRETIYAYSYDTNIITLSLVVGY